jgi:hypothetical protein
MQISKSLFFSGIVFCIGFAASLVEAQTSITIATVNNDDMNRMQALSANFTDANPDIELNWVTLEEKKGMPQYGEHRRRSRHQSRSVGCPRPFNVGSGGYQRGVKSA